MFAVDHLLLVGGLLVLVGVASSRFSARWGMPALVLFVVVGMLAGSDGLGVIAFEDYHMAHGLGTMALALILFDGGLRTSVASARPALGPALSLATVGVLVTAGIAGAAATWVLGLPPLQGLLLGSIVASTDAAAVFAVLRFSGLRLRGRLAETLEVESGSNDPMAIFLTIGILEILLGRMEPGADLLLLFVRQMGLGAVVGIVGGRATAWALRKMDLAAVGLYPVFATAAGLAVFGAAASLHGSGFLAVYLAGVVVGNSRIQFRHGILLFHDGAAWLAQIAMFVMLGLLSFPARLVQVAPPALAIAAVLIVVARPVAVALALLPFRFSVREVAFVSWAGLKGAVPIVLALYPLLLGLPGAETLFDVVFFVVLVSALLQGWSLPALARRLGLESGAPPEPPVTLELTSLRGVHGDIAGYTVAEGSRLAGRTVRELALPTGAVVALIARGEEVVPPQGSTRLREGDHLFLVLTPEARPLVDRVLSPDAAAGPLLPAAEFPLRGATTVAELEEFYGVRVDEDGERTLEEVVRDRLEGEVREGAGIVAGGVCLRVRAMSGGRIEEVGLAVLEDEGGG